MQRYHSFVVWPALGLVACLVAGCGGGGGPKPTTGKVHGKVLYNGKALTKGTVIFVPIPGKGGETGQSASGAIEPDGTFSLTTFNSNDGAILGQHTAVIQSGPEIEPGSVKGAGTMPGAMPEFGGKNAAKPAKPAVPEKYTSVEKSPLKYTVEKEGNTFEIELKD